MSNSFIHWRPIWFTPRAMKATISIFLISSLARIIYHHLRYIKSIFIKNFSYWRHRKNIKNKLLPYRKAISWCMKYSIGSWIWIFFVILMKYIFILNYKDFFLIIEELWHELVLSSYLPKFSYIYLCNRKKIMFINKCNSSLFAIICIITVKNWVTERSIDLDLFLFLMIKQLKWSCA